MKKLETITNPQASAFLPDPAGPLPCHKKGFMTSYNAAKNLPTSIIKDSKHYTYLRHRLDLKKSIMFKITTMISIFRKHK
jgi:hypothetical protein